MIELVSTLDVKELNIKELKNTLAQALAQAARARPAARARDLRKELAQALAQATRASKSSVWDLCVTQARAKLAQNSRKANRPYVCMQATHARLTQANTCI